MDAGLREYFYLIPVALVLGVAGLGAFLWSLRNGQYEDLDGAAERILFDDDVPLKDATREKSATKEVRGGSDRVHSGRR